jgi:hypothetical protein
VLLINKIFSGFRSLQGSSGGVRKRGGMKAFWFDIIKRNKKMIGFILTYVLSVFREDM